MNEITRILNAEHRTPKLSTSSPRRLVGRGPRTRRRSLVPAARALREPRAVTMCSGRLRGGVPTEEGRRSSWTKRSISFAGTRTRRAMSTFGRTTRTRRGFLPMTCQKQIARKTSARPRPQSQRRRPRRELEGTRECRRLGCAVVRSGGGPEGGARPCRRQARCDETARGAGVELAKSIALRSAARTLFV